MDSSNWIYEQKMLSSWTAYTGPRRSSSG
jgi:hypothetical protein